MTTKNKRIIIEFIPEFVDGEKVYYISPFLKKQKSNCTEMFVSGYEISVVGGKFFILYKLKSKQGLQSFISRQDCILNEKNYQLLGE